MLLSVSSRPSVPFFLLIPTTFLLIAYIYAVYTRPKVPPHAKVNDPGKFGWPEWYRKGGIIPYDVYPLSEEGRSLTDVRKSVLLFIDLPYDHPKIPHALEIMDTLDQDPNVNLNVITPWLESWIDEQSVEKNIEAVGCSDWIWRVGGQVGDMGGACSSSVLISEIVTKSFGSTDQIPVDPRANITLMPQPHDLVHPEKTFQALSETHGEDWEMGLFSHILPYADHDNYHPSREILNRKSVTYFPRRETPSSQIPNLPWGRDWHIYKPDRLSPPPKHIGVNPLIRGSAYRRFWAKEESKRGHAMRSSGICLFEGWQNGILDERVVQAMLSGCVAAIVQPDVQHDVLAPFIIPLAKPDDMTHPKLPHEELKKILSKMPSSELKRKALHAFIFARQRFVPATGVKSVVETTRKWEEGGRGYMFPNGWRWTCSTGSSADRPPWCVS